MSRDTKTPNRFADTHREKPQLERAEHANLERPGAQAHPRFATGRGDGDWSRYVQPAVWRLH